MRYLIVVGISLLVTSYFLGMIMLLILVGCKTAQVKDTLESDVCTELVEELTRCRAENKFLKSHAFPAWQIEIEKKKDK